MHRVFPSDCAVLHLHNNFNFIELALETAGQSLLHSCRTELTRQGILLPQDHQSYGRRLLVLHKKSFHFLNFALQHWAGVRFYTLSFNFAESYVFIKQSLPPFKFLALLTFYPEVTKLICRVPSTLLILLFSSVRLVYMRLSSYGFCIKSFQALSFNFK